MSNIVFIAASIDGYIAGTDGNNDWLTEIPNPAKNDYGFFEFLDRIDGIIMGRNTFETAAKFNEWPFTHKVFVLSNTLKDIPGHLAGKAEIINGEPVNILQSLKDEGYHNLYIDGGKTIQSFLIEDLIDEINLTRVPIILGNGIPLFAPMDSELRFSHIKTEVYDNGLVKSRYVRKRQM